MGANVAAEKGRGNIIDVDPDKCIACGACLDVCEHGAREYIDDVDRFFEDLKRGTRISVLIAPAFLANYPNEYEKYLGSRSLVSTGLSAYPLELISQHGVISSTLPRENSMEVYPSPVLQLLDTLNVTLRS